MSVLDLIQKLQDLHGLHCHCDKASCVQCAWAIEQESHSVVFPLLASEQDGSVVWMRQQSSRICTVDVAAVIVQAILSVMGLPLPLTATGQSVVSATAQMHKLVLCSGSFLWHQLD